MKRFFTLEDSTGFSPEKMEVAKAVAGSSKEKEKNKRRRKSVINPDLFVADVLSWQRARPPLFTTDQNINVVTSLLLGEIAEVAELRKLEGLTGYKFKSEQGEAIDSWFFGACLHLLVQSQGGTVDYQLALHQANGQTNGSHAIEMLTEVAGNLSRKSLEKDSQYLWTLLFSYLINMKYPVNPNKVLHEYTLPKNNGNYPEELLRSNSTFELEKGRKMDKSEELAYFVHFRKALRLIRDFLIEYVDANIEHTGLKPEHYRPYKMFIESFMYFGSVGLSPQQALTQLEAQLHTDYNIPRTAQTPVILRANSRLPN